jgi:hypothetical protein
VLAARWAGSIEEKRADSRYPVRRAFLNSKARQACGSSD